MPRKVCSLLAGGEWFTNYSHVPNILSVTEAQLPFKPLHTDINQNAYSPYCSLYISLGADKENLHNNQELP